MSDEPEIWLPVEGEPYEVSDLGRVRRVDGKPLKGRRHTNGYVRVSLCGDRDRYIHRLVCAAFHGPPFFGAHADHVNGVRDDNRAVNLRWLSPEQNRNLRKLRRGSSHGNSKINERFVRDLRLGRITGSDAEIAARIGVSRSTVRDARNGRIWKHV